jgi:hypothetical protein
MEGIPSELVIVGGVGLVLLAAVIVVKFGKQIVTALLVIAGVVVVVLIGWALLQRPDLIPDGTQETISDVADIARVFKSEPEPALQPTYTAPAPSGGGFCAGVFVALLIVALGVGGYFYARWKLAEQDSLRPESRQRRKTRGQSIIYVIEGQADDLGKYDLIPWEEVDEWTEGEFLQF